MKVGKHENFLKSMQIKILYFKASKKRDGFYSKILLKPYETR